MAKTITELTLDLNANVASLKKDLAAAKNQLGSFQKGVKSIGDSIKGAFAVGAIVAAGKAIFDFGKEALELGGQLKGVKSAFDAMNQPDLLNQMREATKGTVSDLELMKNAVKANEFNIPVEKMATMMQFASMQAQKMGGSVDYMVDSITTGLARGSLPILDNLGLSAKELQAEMKKTGNVTDAAFNVINKKIAATGGLVETGAMVTAKWSARWQNMKADIGVLIDNVLVKISPILEDIRAWFINLWQTSAQFVVDTYNGWVDLYNKSMVFRMGIEWIAFQFKAMWSTAKLVFNMLVDSFKDIGRQIAYVFNPNNWGKGFMTGLQKIQQEGAAEFKKDIQTFGSEIGTAFMDGIDNVANGQKSHISLDNMLLGQSLAGAKQQATKMGEEIKQAIVKPLKSIKEEIKTENEDIFSFNELAAEIYNDSQKIVDVMQVTKQSLMDGTNELKSFVNDSISYFAESIGKTMAGAGEGLAGILRGFLNIILDFGTNLGKQLIALGTASLALKAMFSNPFTAIAAGIGLIALMASIRALVNKGGPKFANGGIVPGLSFSGDRVPILANSGEMVLNATQQSNLFKQLNGGNNRFSGRLVTKMSGSDILFIVEQEKRKQSYSY